MNTGLVLDLVKEEAADANEGAAGLQCSSHKEPSLSVKEKHTDYHNEVNCRLQGRGDGPKATLVISGPGPRAPLLLISALARPIEWG